MARAKAVAEEVVETTTVAEERTEVAKASIAGAKKKYALDRHNFTAVGETFLTLCNPEIEIDETNTALINSAEEQVKLGVLKLVK